MPSKKYSAHPKKSYKIGVTISNQDKTNYFHGVGTPICISSDVSRSQTYKLYISAGAKLILLHACFDTPRLVSGRARLLFRCREEGGKNNEPLSCICNYLGGNDGGSALSASTSLGGMEASGPCLIEIAVDGSDCNGKINVFGHVLARNETNKSTSETATCSEAGGFQTSNRRRKNQCNRSIHTFKSLQVFMTIVVMLSFFGLFQIGRSNVGLDAPSRKHRVIRQLKREPNISSKKGAGPPQSYSLPEANTLPTLPPASLIESYIPTQSDNQVEQSSISLMNSTNPTKSSFPTIECMNLSLSLQIPKLLQSELHPFNWTIVAIGTNESIAWSMFYNYTENGNRRDAGSHSIFQYLSIVENASGVNVMDESVCLPSGSYSLSFASPQDSFDSGLLDRTIYIVSSNGEKVRCGIGSAQDITFHVPDPLESPDSEPTDDKIMESGCLLPQCSSGDRDCPQLEYEARSCFYGAFEEMKYNYAFLQPIISRGKWFDERCGPTLADACNTRHHLGFTNNTVWQEVDSFCAYHECAFRALEWGTAMDDYHACECLYEKWYCHWDEESEKCKWGGIFQDEINECCTEDISLATSCECVIEAECKDGDYDMCKAAAAFCCEDGDDSCNAYLEIGCERSLQVNADDIEICTQLESEICSVHKLDSSCKCDFWEPLCVTHGGNSCDKALVACCDTDRGTIDGYDHSGLRCGCDFLSFLEGAIGYDSKGDIGVFCSKAENELLASSSYESADLYSLYREMHGDGWLNKSGWEADLSLSFCDWYGITCNEGGRVVGINLRRNNLTGTFPSYAFQSLTELEILDLSGNLLNGSIEYFFLFSLRKLVEVDLSDNHLTGEADILFSPSIEYLNLSHNKFEKVGSYKIFKTSHNTLQGCDLSHNNIHQNATDILIEAPPKLSELKLSDNSIYGKLPHVIVGLERMRRFFMDNNCLHGTIPDIPRSFPFLKELSLSNQRICQALNSSVHSNGLSGSIPGGLSNLFDLGVLDLSRNKFYGIIPTDIGNLPRLKQLNLSRNQLTSTIPYGLGKLSDSIDVLDLSYNTLIGPIPSVLGQGQFAGAAIHLVGNEDFVSPAPLSLCFDVAGFDLRRNPTMCPLERNALKKFFVSSKGQEWVLSSGWADDYSHHCSWHGVVCNDAGQVIELHLANNGLGGTLTKQIANLAYLIYLDLSDNGLKGSVPQEIGQLTQLEYLRMSYNGFTGELPTAMENIENLQLLHLHGNRLTGIFPQISAESLNDTSSFISDCGVPSDFETPLSCVDCTMCCNLAGECHSTEAPKVFRVDVFGFKNSYEELTFISGLALLGYVLVVVVASFLRDKISNKSLTRATADRSVKVRDKKYALDTIGEGSVYSFFLSKSYFGWTIAFAVIAIQSWILSLFVKASQLQFADDSSDFVYSYRCPRNDIECNDTADQDAEGWLMFSFLMASHLLTDLLNGTKLLVLCAKQRHSTFSRIRFFVGGACLVFISSYTVYASTVYNLAIARSNTEIVVNSVIILFIIQVDEQLYTVFQAGVPRGMKKIKKHLVVVHDNKASAAPPGEEDDCSFKEDDCGRSDHNNSVQLNQAKITQYFGAAKVQDCRTLTV